MSLTQDEKAEIKAATKEAISEVLNGHDSPCGALKNMGEKLWGSAHDEGDIPELKRHREEQDEILSSLDRRVTRNTLITNIFLAIVGAAIASLEIVQVVT